MTATPVLTFPNMDLLHPPDDTMDLVSSPHLGDDLDLDYEPMRDASVEPVDASVADPSHQAMERDELFDDDEFIYADDMIDDNPAPQHGGAQEDLVMETETQGGEGAAHGEVEILYDDEEPSKHEVLNEVVLDDVDSDDEDDLLHEEKQEENLKPILENKEQGQDLTLDRSDSSLQVEDITNQGPEEFRTTEDDPGTDNSKYEAKPTEEEIKTPVAVHDHLHGDQYPEYDTETPSQPEHAPNADSGNKKVETGEAPQSPASFENHAPEGRDIQDTVERNPAQFATSAASVRETIEDPQVTHQVQPLQLHPVKVNYQDSEICLFPPKHDDDGETFFLSDASLAYQSLNKLLSACREVLAGTIDDDDELVLDVASLGLHICEDSIYAAQITLSSILDVYLALSHNEQPEQIQPLYCSLRSRVSLASQYAYLLHAAQDGKSFTEIVAEHIGSPDESTNEVEDVTENADFSSEKVVNEHEVEGSHLANSNRTQENGHSEQPIEGPWSSEDANSPSAEMLEKSNSEEKPPVVELEPDAPEAQGLEDEGSPTSTVRGDGVDNQEPDTLSTPSNLASAPQNQYALSVLPASDTYLDNQTPDVISDHVGVEADIEKPQTSRIDAAHIDQRSDKNDTESLRDVAPAVESPNHQAIHSTVTNEFELDETETALEEEDLFDDHHGPEQEPDQAEDGTTQGPSGADELYLTEDPDLLELDGNDGVDHHHQALHKVPDGATNESRAEADEDIFDTEKTSPAVGNATHDSNSPNFSDDKSSKRKIREDADDFDLLDFDTPESKRQRPS